jgi:hypothetical protein
MRIPGNSEEVVVYDLDQGRAGGFEQCHIIQKDPKLGHAIQSLDDKAESLTTRIVFFGNNGMYRLLLILTPDGMEVIKDSASGDGNKKTFIPKEDLYY